MSREREQAAYDNGFLAGLLSVGTLALLHYVAGRIRERRQAA